MDRMKHGTTTACGPECDRLLAGCNNGETKHTFAMEMCLAESDARLRDGVTARRVAYKRAGFGPEYNDATVSTMLRIKLVNDAYHRHKHPDDQMIVRAKAAIEKRIIDESLLDYTDLLTDEPEEEAVKKLVRLICNGRQSRVEAEKTGKPVDLFEAGVAIKYPTGQAPPLFKKVASLARRCGEARMRPIAELKEAGLSVHIDSIRRDSQGVLIPVVERVQARKLLAMMSQWLSLSIQLPQAEGVAANSIVKMMDILPPALEAMSQGSDSTAVFVRDRAADLAAAARRDEPESASMWKVIQEETAGSHEDVLSVIVGWVRR